MSETKFLGNDVVMQKLEDFGFEDSGDGFYDYFIPFTEYCACVDLDDMGAFIEDSQGNHMKLPFMRGQERVGLSGTVVDEFLDFIRDIEREADSVGGDISYMFESKKLRKSSNESNKTFTRRRSNRMNESSRYRNIVNDKNKRAVRKAVDIINKFIDDEAVFLPDVLDRNSNTYWAIKEYVGSDWNLDADAIINDWELDQSQDHEYDLNPGGFDPRQYLFNVLVYVVGYDYDEAERILNI